MRLHSALLLFAAAVDAIYSGDIVQYWVDQTAILVNGTVIGGLQSPPSAWVQALTQGAIYLAAVNSAGNDLGFQQLAVSVAGHNTLSWIFHGTRNFASVDVSFNTVETLIGLDIKTNGSTAAAIGKNAARTVIASRADDGFNDFVDYKFGPQNPGVYQTTPGGSPLPDTPQAVYVRLFAELGDVTKYRVPPPPKYTDPGYDEYVDYVKTQGAQNSTARTLFDTQTAYIWRESAPVVWNRIATAVIGNSLAKNVTRSAKFYAVLNYALANAGIAAWNIKFQYNNWRPDTAILRKDIWLPSGHNVSDPSWVPLLRPTPSHPDYISTHATFGGAGSRVIRWYNGGDKVSATWSSNVTLDNVGVLTRTITNLTAAAIENGNSRVFGGLHFPFSSTSGIQLGTTVAEDTIANFDRHWNTF